MRYISICSGIEAATVAWRPLGWEAVAFAEIEPFPNAVLSRHYPDVPNLGDISKVDWRKYYGAVDLVVGGTPCQSFSIAGRREGLDGASGLVREYFRLLGDVRPRWFVWENVPGCLSSGGGADFAFILGQWEKLGYHVAWRVLDAQYFGVAQRRRRVFAVGHLGGWQYPAAVLFESGCMSGHPAPSRKEGKENSRSIEAGAGTAKPLLTKDRHNAGDENPVLAKCLTSRNQRLDWETETLVLNEKREFFRSKQFSDYVEDDVASTERSAQSKQADVDLVIEPIVFEPGVMSRDGGHVYDGVAPTLRQNQRNEVRDLGDVAGALQAEPGMKQQTYVRAPVAPTIGASGPPYSRPGNERVEADALVCMQTAVRRLTPIEVERLQGFPDDYTNIEFKGKPAPDTARYKALGNSMAVPCMRWLGERIEICSKRETT